MHEISIHKAASKPTDATFQRLYISGKGKEKWREQQRASQEAAITQSKPSPTRRRSMDRSHSEGGRRDVFQELYEKRHNSAKRSVSPKDSPTQPKTPTGQSNMNRLDLSERHLGPQVHRTPVMTSSRREKLHQRLFENAAERQNNLAMMQALRETSGGARGVFSRFDLRDGNGYSTLHTHAHPKLVWGPRGRPHCNGHRTASHSPSKKGQCL